MTDFIAGFNITVEKEREELEEMVNDLLEIEKIYFNKQELFTKLEKENAELKKLLKAWESFEELYGQYTIPVEGNSTSIAKLMIDTEIDNDYYPGEAKKDEY